MTEDGKMVPRRWSPRMGNDYDSTLGAIPAGANFSAITMPSAGDAESDSRQRGERWEERPVAIGRVPGEEFVPLERVAGRVLSQDVVCRLPVPNWPLAGTDGWALRSAEFAAASTRKTVEADRYAPRISVPGSLWCTTGFGASAWLNYERLKDKPELMYVGALRPMPFDTDAVLNDSSPYLRGRTLAQRRHDQRIHQPIPSGYNVVGQGADLPTNASLLSRGQRLGAKEKAMLGTSGICGVGVFKKPRVGVMVCHGELRRPDHQAPTGWLPDGITPMVLELLERWNFEAEEVQVLPLNQTHGNDFDLLDKMHDFRSRFDLTVTLGGGQLSYGSDALPLPSAVSYFGSQNPRHVVNPNEEDGSGGTVEAGYTLHMTCFKGLGCGSITRRVPKAEPLPEVVGMPLGWTAGLTALPLPALVEMYLMVRPALLALSGVGDFAVPAMWHEAGRVNGSLRIDPQAPYAPAKMAQDLPAGRAHVPLSEQPGAGPVDPDAYAKAIKLFAEGASKERWRRQNTRWFTGVLVNPAPRDAERHWLQLAQLESQDDGRMGVRVLPTEEYQVRHLNEAEAICMIDKAHSPEDTEFPPGTVVHYFLLD